MRDLHSNVSLASLIAAGFYDADTALVSADLQGFDAAEVVILAGPGGITFSTSNKIEFVLTHSDEASANFTPVAQDDVLGVTVATGGIVVAFTAAKAAASVHRLGYIGGKRYLRLLADFSGTHGTETALAACAVRGLPQQAPTANQP